MLDDLLGIRRKVACDLCGKEVLHMNSHLKNMHGERKPDCSVEVDCGQCDKTILLTDMRDHVLNYHIRLEQSPSLSDESPPPSQHKAHPEQGQEKTNSRSQGQNFQELQKANVSDEVIEINDSNDEIKGSDMYDGDVIELLGSSDDDENDKTETKATVEGSVVNHYQSNTLECLKTYEDDQLNNNIQVSKTSDGDELTKDLNDFHSSLKSLDESCNNNIEDSKVKIDVKSFLYDESEDTDDSDIVIEELMPSVSKLKSDTYENRELMKVQFLVKCREKTLTNEKVKSMRLVMRSVKTVDQAKRKYSIKQVLDNSRVGELQFFLEGKLLANEEMVGPLDNKIVMAQRLRFYEKLP